jgi:hypothetical protein
MSTMTNAHPKFRDDVVAVARLREQHSRQASAKSDERAVGYAARLDAERQAVRATYTKLDRPQWCQRAAPHEVACTRRLSLNVRRPDAVGAEQRIVEEVRAR